MIEKSLDEMVENTTDLMEDFLRTHIPQNIYQIHEDIEIMRIFMDISQKPDYETSEHELNTVMEALLRCKNILEYGDKLMGKIKPVYIDPLHIFGVN